MKTFLFKVTVPYKCFVTAHFLMFSILVICNFLKFVSEGIKLKGSTIVCLDITDSSVSQKYICF